MLFREENFLGRYAQVQMQKILSLPVLEKQVMR